MIWHNTCVNLLTVALVRASSRLEAAGQPIAACSTRGSLKARFRWVQDGKAALPQQGLLALGRTLFLRLQAAPMCVQ